jgi:hypothetical protein
VLIKAGVLKSDNTPVDSEAEAAAGAQANEIIEMMARADVNYFWVQGGKRFEAFEKPVTAGVRKRMRAIHAALESAGYNVHRLGRCRKPNSAQAKQGSAMHGGRTITSCLCSDARGGDVRVRRRG